MRKLGIAFVLLMLLIPIVAVSAPQVGLELQEWMDQTDVRLDALEAATTTTTPITTTTVPPTTTTIPPTTTTVPPTTTTIPPTTTTIPPTTTTVPPTTTTTEPSSGNSLLILADTLINEPIILRAGDTIEFRNGARLSCGLGCHADWQGTPTSTWSDDGLAQNLQRDIKIFGEGDIRFEVGSGVSTIRYVEIDLQPLGELGHYPLHWHLIGDNSRGTLVEGVVIKNSTNRAFVPHGSNGITFRDTIASNIAGAAYWWDSPGTNEFCQFRKQCTLDNSNNTIFDHALADTITNRVGDNRGFTLTAFRLGAGSGNQVFNSVARNINPSHIKNCSGFKWPSQANQNVGGNVWLFENNKTFDDRCHGIFVWQNDSNDHIIDGFVGPSIGHGAYGNDYDYRNVNVNRVVIHAVGWSMSDSTAGDVVSAKHQRFGTVIFTNVTMTSFTVDNDHGSTRKPAIYILNNVGLTCGDIIYQSVVDGTEVILDGEACLGPG